LKLIFDNGVDGIPGRTGNPFAGIECFYLRGIHLVQVLVPGCFSISVEKKVFLDSGKTVKKREDFGDWS
jgi:hypothetical protein